MYFFFSSVEVLRQLSDTIPRLGMVGNLAS